MIRDRERYEKRVGTVVDGRWRIDSLLGRGSTAAVYAATHRNGHRATLKILHPALCADPAIIERFLREAGIANAIKHRAIVPIGDDGTTEDGCAYLVLELLDGETLDDIKERGGGRIPLEELAPMADEMMSALSAVHAAGVIHRDLKPGNVFITTEKRLKLLDFGTARIFDRAGNSKLSVQGLVLGTPSFMSPEQAKGIREEVDAQSDVWALGAMFFTLLSGENVHEGKDDHQRLLAAALKPARSLASVAPAIDARVVTVIDRALAYAKHDRWPDVQSMRGAFRNAVLACVPTLRDLRAYADLSAKEEAEPEAAPNGPSSDPTIVMDAPPEMEELRRAPAKGAAPGPTPSDASAPESPIKPVRRRGSSRIPVLALVVGLGAMAVVVALVVFFVMGGDVSTGRSATSPVVTEPSAVPAPEVAPAPSSSFIVISAPDLPESAPKPPAWATAPPKNPTGPLKTKSAATASAASASAEAPPVPPPPATSEKPPTGGMPDDPGF